MVTRIEKFLEQAEKTPKGIKLWVGIYAYPEDSGDNVLLLSTPEAVKRLRTREEAVKFAGDLAGAMYDEVN